MTRNGKIARLPQTLREQINRRLLNGEQGKQIVAWLNTLPEAQAVMAAEFDGKPIHENNLSKWRLGGYRDWQAQEDALEAIRRFGQNALELSQASGGPLTEPLAVCLAARLAVALQEQPADQPDPDGQLRRLRQLCAEVVALRKGDHEAQKLRLAGELLELKRAEQAARK